MGKVVNMFDWMIQNGWQYKPELYGIAHIPTQSILKKKEQEQRGNDNERVLACHGLNKKRENRRNGK